jgi:hypothetical protein
VPELDAPATILGHSQVSHAAGQDTPPIARGVTQFPLRFSEQRRDFLASPANDAQAVAAQGGQAKGVPGTAAAGYGLPP